MNRIQFFVSSSASVHREPEALAFLAVPFYSNLIYKKLIAADVSRCSLRRVLIRSGCGCPLTCNSCLDFVLYHF